MPSDVMTDSVESLPMSCTSIDDSRSAATFPPDRPFHEPPQRPQLLQPPQHSKQHLQHTQQAGDGGGEAHRIFPRSVIALKDRRDSSKCRVQVRSAAAEPRHEVTTSIPCTDESAVVVVFWESRRVRIDSAAGLKYSYLFGSCKIRSVWTERSKQTPTHLVRRAVLSVQSHSEWCYTLAPTEPLATEVVIPLLVKLLGPNRPLNATSSRRPADIYRLVLAERNSLKPSNIFKAFLLDPPITSDASQPPPQPTRSTIGSRDVKSSELSPQKSWDSLWANVTKLFTVPLNIFVDTCSARAPLHETFLRRMGITQSNLEKMVFGDTVHWSGEPVMPVQIFYTRHGQQEFPGETTFEFGPHLSHVGESQSVRAGMFIEAMTSGFSNTIAIWSSRLYPSTETADIIKCLIELRSEVAVPKEIPRLYNNLLGEFIPPYGYRLEEDATEGSPRSPSSGNSTAKDNLRRELAADAQSMEDGRWLVSAALRGSGILVPQLHRGEAKYPSVHIGLSDQCREGCRLPSLAKPTPSVGGVYVGHSPSHATTEEKGAMSFIYSGHGNTLRFHIFEELGMPPHFWRHAQLPHCSVVLGGVHHTGRAAMVLADAAYLTNYIPDFPIPYTYTPALSGGLPASVASSAGYSFKENVSNDEFVSLLHEEEWWARSACEGVLYNAPPEEYHFEKNIVMIRAGHNMVHEGVDVGITELGRLQLTAAGTWLSKFLTSGRVIMPPKHWCIAGITSSRSTIDTSLKESITVLKAALEKDLSEPTHNRSLVPDAAALFPENLFAAPTSDRELFVVVSDDYHLFKYFGACFGVKPAILRNLFWPHAGYILLTQTEHGWPEMRVFGSVSYLPPDKITLLPELPEGPTVAEVYDSTKDRRSSSGHRSRTSSMHSNKRRPSTPTTDFGLKAVFADDKVEAVVV